MEEFEKVQEKIRIRLDNYGFQRSYNILCFSNKKATIDKKGIANMKRRK